jgi:hypothetical protein
MKLLFISFMLGIGFELTLFFSILAEQGDMPDGVVAHFVVAAHSPITWFANHHVPFPLDLIVSIVLAVLVWSGIFYSILRLLKRLFRKHDNVA